VGVVEGRALSRGWLDERRIRCLGGVPLVTMMEAANLLKAPYELRPSRIDEKAIRDEDPLKLTQKLADTKVWKIAEECPDAIIVSGDAVVALGDKILEKPRDRQEAVEFLRELSSSEFRFVTALTALNSRTAYKLSTVETSNIWFICAGI
jgi:predicted house-cleaning NTP pyrophosphatase (Maf/HAM1 superfamily)